MPTEVEWAWLAGLYEGEGSLANQATNQVQFSIGMADRDIIDRCHSLFDVGHVYRCPEIRSPKHSTIWRWRVYRGEDITWVLKGIEP